MRRDLPIALVLFVLALWQNLGHVDGTEFHRDEARWIHRGHYLRELADPLGETWRDRELTRGQPPLGSYLMGLGLVAQGHDLDTNGLWNFHFGDAWNRRHGRMPTRVDLEAARRTNSVVGALTVVVAYAVGRRLSNRLAGVVAGLFLIAHPLSLYLHSLAGSDALLTLLIALAVLVAIALADRPSWGRAILLGVLLGLGGATKLSPLFLVLPLAGIGAGLVGLAWWRRRRGEPSAADPTLGWQLLSLPVVTYAAFVVAYPYLWPDPFGRTLNLFRFRAQEMEAQGEIWDELEIASRTEALTRIGDWLEKTLSTTGWLVAWLAERVGLDWHPRGLDLPLALIGAEILIALAFARGYRSRHAFAAVVLGGQVALIVIGMRADFERYLLPIVFAAAVCVGLVAGEGWVLARRLLAGARAGDPGPVLDARSPVPSRRAARPFAVAHTARRPSAAPTFLRARRVVAPPHRGWPAMPANGSGSDTLAPPRQRRPPRVRSTPRKVPAAVPGRLVAAASSATLTGRPAEPGSLRSDATA